MTRPGRITVEILLPPLAAVLLFLVIGLLSDGPVPMSGVIFMLGVAYVYAFLPCLVYSAVMEFAYASGLSPSSWQSVGLSLTVGGGAGLVIGVLYPEPFRADIVSVLVMVGAGLFAGAITGGVIYVWDTKSNDA